MKSKFNQIAGYVKEHDIEFIAGTFVAVIVGLAIKYPDSFLVEEVKDEPKQVVEVHHYYH